MTAGLLLFVIVAFGGLVIKRSALRRVPQTDLGVFCAAAGAVKEGRSPYEVTDWHDWHYHYPPMLAILFRPLAIPPPERPKRVCTAENPPPWGFSVGGIPTHYGLRAENARFFWIALTWYTFSAAILIVSLHAAACAVEETKWTDPPPGDKSARRLWQARRLGPFLICLGSVGTEFSRGQVDVLMLGAIAMGLYWWSQKRELASGIALSIPAAIKLFPPFLLLYPALQRRWRTMAAVFAGLILTLAIIPLSAFGPHRTVELYRTWADVLAKPAVGRGIDNSRAKELTNLNATDNQFVLQAIHNWRYFDIPRRERPPHADRWERWLAYGIGGPLALAAFGLISVRRFRTGRNLVLGASLLICVAFLCNPIVHEFYFLLLLPLMAVFAGDVIQATSATEKRLAVVAATVFMAVDMIARLPNVGPLARDLGLPMLSLLVVLAAAAVMFLKPEKVTLPPQAAANA